MELELRRAEVAALYRPIPARAARSAAAGSAATAE
jgi:hypothetical protein